MTRITKKNIFVVVGVWLAIGKPASLNALQTHFQLRDMKQRLTIILLFIMFISLKQYIHPDGLRLVGIRPVGLRPVGTAKYGFVQMARNHVDRCIDSN